MKKQLVSMCLAASMIAGMAVGATAVSADDENVIKIGFLTPLSGDTATYGKQCRAAGEMIADLINTANPDMKMALAAEAGLPNLDGAKIELVVADSKGDPSTAASEAKRLITEEGVVAMTGQYTSAITKAVAVITENYEIPLLSAGSSPSLTEPDMGFEWYFRFGPNDTTYVEDSFNFIDQMVAKGEEIKTVGFACEDSEFGTYIKRELERIAGEHGYEIVCDITYSGSATNVSSEVMKIKDANPDVLLMSSYSSDAILYFKTFKEQMWAPKMLIGQRGGFIQTDFLDTMGLDTEYVYTTAGWSSDLDSDVVREVIEKYKDFTPDGATLSEGHVKDAINVLMLALAFNQAGTTDAEEVRTALRSLDVDTATLPIPWNGIDMDEYGQNKLANAFVVQMQDQTYQTVYPDAYKKVDPVYPMPAWDAR
ncbi:MAG: ABC transporter substrate-binding protein [Lachnospiraceae bacterium]|nr:ABC transporter substrate-binding protein [Lachnospiraceae bacterium]